MNILITSFTFPPERNGVSNVASAHAFGLAQRGHKVTVATGYNPSRISQQLQDGVDIIQFEISGNCNLLIGYQGDIDSYRRFLSSFDCDVILFHCWQIWSTDLAFNVFKNTKAKKILISHGVSANSTYGFPRSIPHWLAWRPYIWKMPIILKSVDHVIFLADQIDQDRFYDRFLVERHKLTNFSVIPNGTHWAAFQNKRLDFRNTFNLIGKRIVLCLSNYEPLKNQEMILRAYLRSSPKDAVLVFIGEKRNQYSDKLIKLFLSSSVRAATKPHVIFLENIDDEMQVAAYQEADLFVLGSKTETLPLVLLDAMAAGTPFISTDVGCVSKLPGGVAVKSEQEMAIQLSDLLNNEERRNNLSNAGRIACQNTYNWDKIVSDYDSLLQRIVQ
jgi:glycosyltransferase involved in cell wall biosynthesis